MQKIEKHEELLDQFAGIALSALIAKSPFFDAQGVHGKQVDQDELSTVKRGIADTAYEYASYMLIAREESLIWLQKNTTP